jgi:hypothetical protein
MLTLRRRLAAFHEELFVEKPIEGVYPETLCGGPSLTAAQDDKR